MIEFKSINKRFKTVIIADNIDLKLDKFTYGLLGQNGSGKTTLLRCITGIEKADSGIITLFHGEQIKNSLDKIGYLPQSFDIFNSLAAAEVLEFFANLKNVTITSEEIKKLLRMVNLTEKENCPVKNLSGGMKRRLGIAQSLIGSPEIILLDEPTAGLDPEERVNFKRVVQEIKKDKCIILSTHIITDIEELCDKILVLKNGKITVFDSPEQLKEIANNKVFAVTSVQNISCKFHTMGQMLIDGEQYTKVISEEPLEEIKLNPTVEDGYICLIENLV